MKKDKDFEKEVERDFRIMKIIGLVSSIVAMALTGLAIFVIVHFITKFW